jgi:hypothetical protein
MSRTLRGSDVGSRERLAENQDDLLNHQSIDLWRNHHGSVRSGEAQPNLRGASCFSTTDFDFSHDLAIWRDNGDNERIAALSEGTFWLVLPTLPMFLVLPAMLRNGFAFWTALAASCALTVALYLIAVWLLPRLGINV